MDAQDADDTSPLTISCSHGQRPAAVVCRHLVGEAGAPLGFVENSSDPADLQAWCGRCERVFLDEGEEMTPRFRTFNDFVVVCDVCYARIKAEHTEH